jgi:transposase InsO family protein
VRAPRRHLHERIQRRQARPRCWQESQATLVITKANAVLSPGEVLVYEPELAPIEGMKDMRDQKGLRRIERYRCSRLLLTMPSLGDGCDLRDPNVWTMSLFFSEANLRRILSAYVTYYNRWRPHRSLGQAAPCGEASSIHQQAYRKIAAEPVLGGLHHIYRAAV